MRIIMRCQQAIVPHVNSPGTAELYLTSAGLSSIRSDFFQFPKSAAIHRLGGVQFGFDSSACGRITIRHGTPSTRSLIKHD